MDVVIMMDTKPAYQSVFNVFRIPELMDLILDYLCPYNLTAFRLVNKEIHQLCNHRFFMILDSERDFDENDLPPQLKKESRPRKKKKTEVTTEPSTTGNQGQQQQQQQQGRVHHPEGEPEDPSPKPRHRNWSLTRNGRALVKYRAEWIQALDIVLKSMPQCWGFCLLKGAHSIETLRVKRATLTLDLRLNKKDISWDQILFGTAAPTLVSASSTPTSAYTSTLTPITSTIEHTTPASISTSSKVSRKRKATSTSSSKSPASPSLLFQGLESLTVRTQGHAVSGCLIGFPRALQLGREQQLPGQITNTLTSLSISGAIYNVDLYWSELCPCLIACTSLRTLSLRRVILLETPTPSKRVNNYVNVGNLGHSSSKNSIQPDSSVDVGSSSSSGTRSPVMKNLTELSFEQVHMSLEIREAVVTTVCSTVETVRWDEIQLIHWQGTGSNRSGKNNNNTSKNNDDDSNSSIKKDSYDTDFRIDPTTGHKVYRDPKEVMPRLKQVEVGTFTSERQVERVLSWVRDHGIRLIGYIHWGRRDEKVLRALSGLPSLSTPQPQSPTTVLGAEAASEPISSSSSTYNVATITTPTPLAEGRPSCHCELENIKMNVETRQCWMLGIAGSPLRKAAPWSTSTPATSDSTQFLCLRTLRTLEMHELPLSIIPDYLCSVLERELQQTDEYSRLAHKNRYPTEHGVNFLLSRWWLDQLLTPERLAFHMPVVRTLTRLCIAPEAPYCNRLYKKMDHQVWCLCWLNKLLRGTPELREFVLWFPIKNLFVFGGLGKKRAMEQRQQQQESQQRSAQQARSSSSSSSAVSVAASSMASTTTEEQDDFAQLQNPHQSQHQGQQDPEAREVPAPDWTNERPFLEHVHIVRCHYQADLSLLGMKWRLQQQFRFLKTVRVDEQQLR